MIMLIYDGLHYDVLAVSFLCWNLNNTLYYYYICMWISQLHNKIIYHITVHVLIWLPSRSQALGPFLTEVKDHNFFFFLTSIKRFKQGIIGLDASTNSKIVWFQEVADHGSLSVWERSMELLYDASQFSFSINCSNPI